MVEQVDLSEGFDRRSGPQSPADSQPSSRNPFDQQGSRSPSAFSSTHFESGPSYAQTPVGFGSPVRAHTGPYASGLTPAFEQSSLERASSMGPGSPVSSPLLHISDRLLTSSQFQDIRRRLFSPTAPVQKQVRGVKKFIKRSLTKAQNVSGRGTPLDSGSPMITSPAPSVLPSTESSPAANPSSSRTPRSTPASRLVVEVTPAPPPSGPIRSFNDSELDDDFEPSLVDSGEEDDPSSDEDYNAPEQRGRGGRGGGASRAGRGGGASRGGGRAGKPVSRSKALDPLPESWFPSFADGVSPDILQHAATKILLEESKLTTSPEVRYCVEKLALRRRVDWNPAYLNRGDDEAPFPKSHHSTYYIAGAIQVYGDTVRTGDERCDRCRSERSMNTFSECISFGRPETKHLFGGACGCCLFGSFAGRCSFHASHHLECGPIEDTRLLLNGSVSNHTLLAGMYDMATSAGCLAAERALKKLHASVRARRQRLDSGKPVRRVVVYRAAVHGPQASRRLRSQGGDASDDDDDDDLEE